MNELNFYVEDKYLYLSVAKALKKYVDSDAIGVVFVFVGTDGNIGDSLAPLCSSLLSVNNAKIFIYGDLNNPITAKEVPFVAKYIKKAHPNSIIIVVDAAVGTKWDVGRVKVQKNGLKPGLGVNKDLPMIGDLSIIGVVGEKNDFKKGFLPQIRLSSIYKMAKNISKAIEIFVNETFCTKSQEFSDKQQIQNIIKSSDNRLIG